MAKFISYSTYFRAEIQTNSLIYWTHTPMLLSGVPPMAGPEIGPNSTYVSVFTGFYEVFGGPCARQRPFEDTKKSV